MPGRSLRCFYGVKCGHGYDHRGTANTNAHSGVGHQGIGLSTGMVNGPIPIGTLVREST